MYAAAGIALLDQNGLVFLVRRSSRVSHGGSWTIPGGYVDDGESPLQAAVREFKEETGMSLGSASQLEAFSVPTPEGATFSVFIYQGKGSHRSPSLQKGEVDRWLWLEPELAFGLKLHPGMRKILDKVLKVGR